MKDNVKNQQARAVLKRRIISFPNDGELRVESIIREFEDYAMIDCNGRRGCFGEVLMLNMEWNIKFKVLVISCVIISFS